MAKGRECILFLSKAWAASPQQDPNVISDPLVLGQGVSREGTVGHRMVLAWHHHHREVAWMASKTDILFWSTLQVLWRLSYHKDCLSCFSVNVSHAPSGQVHGMSRAPSFTPQSDPETESFWKWPQVNTFIMQEWQGIEVGLTIPLKWSYCHNSFHHHDNYEADTSVPG